MQAGVQNYGLLSLVPQGPRSLRNSENTTETPEEDFIKLMVAQLTNQNPENPADGTALIAQLAQMNAATAMQRMSVLSKENHAVSMASQLIGKKVTVTDNGQTLLNNQTVTGVDFSENKPKVIIKGRRYDLNDITEVNMA
jgi:flagellar basal-body rod modification protein FlgD